MIIFTDHACMLLLLRTWKNMIDVHQNRLQNNSRSTKIYLSFQFSSHSSFVQIKRTLHVNVGEKFHR